MIFRPMTPAHSLTKNDVDISCTSTGGRRRLLKFSMAWGLSNALPALSQPHSLGAFTPPLSLPAGCMVTSADGIHLPLDALLRGNITAVQFMFTGCSQTCPLQGAMFSAVQQQLQQAPIKNARLLSLSIDPLDTPHSLTSWLQLFKAKQGWLAAVPNAHDIEAIQRLLEPRVGRRGPHSSQVYFTDRTGRIVWRSEELPPVEIILKILRQLA